jgi:hypothetical protein
MAQTSNNTDVFAQTVSGGGSSATLFDGFFGDGSDGDATITLVGSPVTLTVDKYYNNLTVDAGATLKPRGQHIFVKNVLTNNGSIHDNGNAGGTGATAGAALSIVSNGFGAASGAGGAGRTTTGVGNNGITSSNCSTNGLGQAPQGGVGGGVSAPLVAGGNPGSAPSPTIPQRWPSLASMLTARTYNGSGTFNGGSGGGSGGCDLTGGTGTSGSGGSGGGIVWIAAKVIANGGTISANGGAGGNGVATGTASCGGGAGGGGGLVGIVTTTNASFGTITANAGAIGTGAGVAPTAAVVGKNGTVHFLVLS